MVLEAAQKLGPRKNLPHNSDGDVKGLILENGQVRVPDSFHEAIDTIAKAAGRLYLLTRRWGDKVFLAPCYCSPWNSSLPQTWPS